MPANDVIPVYEWTANPESSSLFLIKKSGNKERGVIFYKACNLYKTTSHKYSTKIRFIDSVNTIQSQSPQLAKHPSFPKSEINAILLCSRGLEID